MIFSEKLQLIRKSKGLTQEELAEKLELEKEFDTQNLEFQIYQ